MDFSLTEMIAEVRTEIGYREKVYPRLVSGGRMTTAAMHRRIACMRAVLGLLLTKQTAGEPDLMQIAESTIGGDSNG